MKRKIDVLRRILSKSNIINFMLLFSPSIINLLIMHYYFYSNLVYGEILAFVMPMNFLFIIFDSSVILLLFLLLTWGRLKLSLILCYVVTLVWSFSNILYAKFFYRCLSLSAIGQVGGMMDGIVIKGALSGLGIEELFFVGSIILFAFFLFLIPYKVILNKFLMLSLLFTPGIAFVMSILLCLSYHIVNPHTRNNPELCWKRVDEFVIHPMKWKYSLPNNTHFNVGSVRFLLSDLTDALSSKELSDQDIQEIEEDYMDYSLRMSDYPSNPKIKNVVFILLESFLSASSDLVVDCKEITPFLNALKRDSTVYYNGHIHPNITIGESGDGQLIYMTGLLPLRSDISVGVAKNRSLIAFPTLLRIQK